MTWAATAVRMGVSSPLLAEASEALPGAVETRPSGMTRGRIADMHCMSIPYLVDEIVSER